MDCRKIFFNSGITPTRQHALWKNPEELCGLTDIHVLDLGHNNFSGSIPTCLGTLDGYKYLYKNVLPLGKHSYLEHMDLVAKGRQLDYGDPILNTIDLLENSLSGEIPIEITDLSALHTLNLSLNQLTGKIPENIGDLQCLETLDLSCNHLSGPIPQDMTSITTLSSLNLSYNDLFGQIPTSNQFYTFFFYPSIYGGNPQLCGFPLRTSCSPLSDGGAEHNDQENFDDDEGSEELWFYVSIALGFIVGFWTVCGTLVLKKSWRHAYFHFVNEMKDRLFVAISVNMARLQGKIES